VREFLTQASEKFELWLYSSNSRWAHCFVCKYMQFRVCVCFRVCLFACKCASSCVQACVQVHTILRVCASSCVQAFVQVHAILCVFVCVYVCVSVLVCRHVCMIAGLGGRVSWWLDG